MLAFLPSLVFFVIAPLSVSLALWLGFAAAFAVAIRAFGATRKMRLFDLGGLILFGTLALYTVFAPSDFSSAEAGLVLEAGLLATILWSMAKQRPFTAEYGWLKRQHDPQLVIRAHRLLTSAWATCYAVLAGIGALSALLNLLSPGWAAALWLLVFTATLVFTWQSGAYIDKYGGNIPLLKH